MSIKEDMQRAINLEIDSCQPSNVDIDQLKSIVDNLTTIVTDRRNRDRGKSELVRQYISHISLMKKSNN